VAYKLPLVTAIGGTPILLKGGENSFGTSDLVPRGDDSVEVEEHPAAVSRPGSTPPLSR
jgi:hypothetical protein